MPGLCALLSLGIVWLVHDAIYGQDYYCACYAYEEHLDEE